MSTLKKILSLTLALAMLMSVSVFADFADKEEINKECVDAVNLLTSVNILNGFEEDGTFRPEATITRAQAAKMIYVLCNKGVDDKAANWAKGPFSFPDVTINDWFAGYVEFCASYGYVEGRDTGKFDPQDNVTGIELAKMLLTVAGYKSAVQGYTGANWAKAVIADATANGLFEGCNFALAQAAPRQWAAKMFVNAFKVTVPTYIGDYLLTGALAGMGETVAQKYLNYTEATVVVLANKEWAIDGGDKTTDAKVIRVAADDVYAIVENDKITMNDAVSIDLVGKQLKVTYNSETGAIYGYAETGKSEEGKITVSRSGSGTSSSPYKYTVKMGDITVQSAQVAGTALKGDIAVVEAVLGTAYTAPTTVDGLYAMINEATTGFEVYGYDVDGDKNVDYTFISKANYGKVSNKASDGSFKVGSYTVAKAALGTTVTVNGTVADGNVVKVSKNYKTGKVTVDKIDANRYVFNGTNNSKNTFYFAGVAEGLKYSKYAIESAVLTDVANLGKTVDVYTDGKYVVYAEVYVPGTVSGSTANEKLTGSLAMLIDGNKITGVQAGQPDEMGRPAEDTEVVGYRFRLMSADGAIFTQDYYIQKEYKGVIDPATLIEADGEGWKLKDEYKYAIVEYDLLSNPGKISLKAVFTETKNVKFYDKTATAAAKNVAPNAANGYELTFNADRKLFQNGDKLVLIKGDDNTKVFATYKYLNDKNEVKYAYGMVKLSELDKTDKVKVIAVEGTDITTALIARVDIDLTQSGSTAPDTNTAYLLTTTDLEYKAMEGKEGYYVSFKAIDMNDVAAGAKTYTAKFDYTGTYAKNAKFTVTMEEGVVVAFVAEAADAWTSKTISHVIDNMLFVGSDLYVTKGDDNFAKDVKFIVKSGSTYKAGTFENIAKCKADKTGNIQVKLNGEGKIAYVIIDADKQ